MNLKALYITDSINSLDAISQKGNVIHTIKKSHRLTHFANKMMGELLQCQDDQEKCYILCRRYINLVDHLFKISDDQNYANALHSTDYRKVKQLANELKESLLERYKLAVESPLEINKVIQSRPPVDTTQIKENVPKFRDVFISPGDLYKMLQHDQNFLIVDIRVPESFKMCRISSQKGEIINIPENLIIPGLSANTLGKRLEGPTRDIWNRRDSFDTIILIDADTCTYNYDGSKLERLRSFIVEWDTLRHYQEEPAVLNGGLKEFVEWYPTKVNNSQMFLSQTNCEIDELLDLETINYPETGTPHPNTLKLYMGNLVHNAEEPVKRDFHDDLNDLERILPPPALSQEDLTKDLALPKIKEETTDNETVTVDPSIASSAAVEKVKPIPEMDEATVKEIVEGDKAALLRQARQAAKPKIHTEDSESKGDRRRPKSIHKRDRSQSEIEPKRLRDKSPQVIPPAIDRSFKPSQVTGDGFTGLKNVKNICYMNALMQALKVIPPIKASYVTSDRYRSYASREHPKINDHLAYVLKELWGGTSQQHRLFFIWQFKERISHYTTTYDRSTHEDCFEFFMFLFHLISDDCSWELPRKLMTESEKAWYGHLQGRTSFWIDRFYFQFRNTKVCCNCRKGTPTFDTEGVLILPVPTSPCALQDIISDYFQDIKLSDFSCSNCKSMGTIVYKKDLSVQPDVLAIVLKRYLPSDESNTAFKKNEVEVDFPMENLVFGYEKYNLYSVVQHSGGLSHGHYFSSVLLDDKAGTWYCFNDESITRHHRPLNESSYIRSTAAGFFYVRQPK